MGSEVSKDYAIPSITSAFVPNDSLGHSLLFLCIFFFVTECGALLLSHSPVLVLLKVLGLFWQAVSLLRSALSLWACFQLCLGKSEADSDLE